MVDLRKIKETGTRASADLGRRCARHASFPDGTGNTEDQILCAASDMPSGKISRCVWGASAGRLYVRRRSAAGNAVFSAGRPGAGDRQAAFALWHTAPGCAGTDC